MNRTRNQLTAEVANRRAKLEQLKRELLSATNIYKRTRLDHDGASVTDIASRVRLAEMALDGATEELAALDRPRVVEITSSHEELVRYRAEIVQRRAYRHKQHEQQVARERQACGYRDEAHVQTHLRNKFGSGVGMRAKADADDQRYIDHIDAQLDAIAQRASGSAEQEVA